jgi:hypothetical protein
VRALLPYLLAGVVYVAIGVAYPTFLYSSVVAAVYLVLTVWALPEAIRRLRARFR